MKTSTYIFSHKLHQQYYVVLSPGGNFNDACVRAGYALPTDYLVIDYESWHGWYNIARYANSFIIPPRPVFNGKNYEAANAVTTELNDEVVRIELADEVQYAIDKTDAPMKWEG